MTIEDDLRSALHHHADQVEPSGDGLERIQARLEPAVAGRPRLAPRLLAAAALLVVVGVAGALTFRASGTGEVDVAISSSTTDPAAGAVINELPPRNDPGDPSLSNGSGSSVVEGTPAVYDIPLAPAGILGPRSVTPQAAVDSFLGLIQRGAEDVMVELQGDLARVSRVGEGGDVVDVTTLQLGSVVMSDGSTGFVVVQAISPRVVIESPASLSTSSGSVLAISGQGEGFEAQVDVYLYSSHDGVLLNMAYPRAGNFGVLAPFTAELAVSGPGPAWIVAQSSGATNTTLDPFSAIPVVIEAPRAAPNYLVTNIPVGDADGGLVVRSLPGTDGEELGVLPPSQSGVNKRAALSAFIGDGEPSYGLEPSTSGQQEWWNVWLPDPLENGRQWGWVNSHYLAIDAPVVDASLEALGWEFVEVLRGGDAASLPWSPGGVTFGLSSDLATTTSGKAGLPEFWQEVFSFTPPAEFTGTLDGNLREVLSPTRAVLTPDAMVGVEVVPILALSPYTVVNEALATRFGDASVVQLTDLTNDGSGWRLVNLFVQQGVNGSEIVGMVAVEWSP